MAVDLFRKIRRSMKSGEFLPANRELGGDLYWCILFDEQRKSRAKPWLYYDFMSSILISLGVPIIPQQLVALVRLGWSD